MSQDIRAAFEQGYCGGNKHVTRRNEHGDYVLPSIQDAWSGYYSAAMCAPSRPVVEAALKYMTHSTMCLWLQKPGNSECNCGLKEAIAALTAAPQEPHHYPGLAHTREAFRVRAEAAYRYIYTGSLGAGFESFLTGYAAALHYRGD